MDNYNDIDRNALISHLYDVRALELAKHKISISIEKNNQKIRTLGYSSALPKPENFIRMVITCSLTLFITAAFFFFTGVNVFWNSITDRIYCSHSDSYEGFYLNRELDYNGTTYTIPKNPEFGKYVFTSICITIILVLFVAVVTTVFNAKKRSDYNKLKRADDERVSNEQELKEQLIAENEHSIERLKELNTVLSTSYAINIIPQQFRNIDGICYLYDYLSTSRESFQSALVNFNMNKMNLNMQKMAGIQSEMLIQQYITNARILDLKKQNKDMLNKLQAIEENTEIAAKYSAMNEANTRTIAFFKGWDFFSNK